MIKETGRYHLINAIAGVVECFNDIDEAWENYQLRICDAFQFEEDLRKQGMNNTLNAAECRALYSLKDFKSGEFVTQQNYEAMKNRRVQEAQFQSFTVTGTPPFFSTESVLKQFLQLARPEMRGNWHDD